MIVYEKFSHCHGHLGTQSKVLLQSWSSEVQRPLLQQQVTARYLRRIEFKQDTHQSLGPISFPSPSLSPFPSLLFPPFLLNSIAHFLLPFLSSFSYSSNLIPSSPLLPYFITLSHPPPSPLTPTTCNTWRPHEPGHLFRSCQMASSRLC